jgi:hypothetical protein
MRAFLASQRDWLVTERLPAYAPELNPVEGLWSNLEGQELANLACDTLGEALRRLARDRAGPPGVVAAVFVPATRWPLGVMTQPHQGPEPSRSGARPMQAGEASSDVLAVSRLRQRQ